MEKWSGCLLCGIRDLFFLANQRFSIRFEMKTFSLYTVLQLQGQAAFITESGKSSKQTLVMIQML